jgi:hypothetical protein
MELRGEGGKCPKARAGRLRGADPEDRPARDAIPLGDAADGPFERYPEGVSFVLNGLFVPFFPSPAGRMIDADASRGVNPIQYEEESRYA